IPIKTELSWVIEGQRPDYTVMPGISSPNVTWETSTTKNIGADFTFLNNKLSASVDFYERQTDNMFGPISSLPAVLGTTPPKTNSASLITKGWEFVIGWKAVSEDLTYNFNLLLSDNRSFITAYSNPDKVL